MKRPLQATLALLCALACLLPGTANAQAQGTDAPLIRHYMVLGQDYYMESGAQSARTDALILVSLDTAGNRIIFSSILRDCKVTTSGGGENKINSVYRNHGANGVAEVIKRHLDIDIEGVIVFDFNTVKDLIDALGGIDLTINESEFFMIRSILLHRDPNMPTGPGMTHMTGRIALAYMRNRSTGSGDFSRTERQRKVLAQLMNKCARLSLPDLLALYNRIQNGLHTNLDAAKLVQLMLTAYPLMSAEVVSNVIPADRTFAYAELRSSSVLAVNWKRNREALNALLYPQQTPAP
ncbi:MAG: LCP family protein [Oscillospiraceae bacterium]|jgi:LCP family protein required for cell wall assembly|nr:LCP family protein [Oscillospiraceae bacterium]